MNIVGVIAEYNPFHRGHVYHLAKARELTGADYVIVVMSGNYVQRGTPAMFDKYTRAKAALLNGADLVLELPPAIATGSAEYFATGAVKLLTAAGIVTDLCFGSESGILAPLERLSGILAEEPETYQALLKEELRRGMSYPKARAIALHKYDETIPEALLQTPNNLLAVEYLKALKRMQSPIRAHTIPRTGASYHEKHLIDSQSASAGGIRLSLLKSRGTFTAKIKKQLPSCDIYQAYEGRMPVTEDAFSLLLAERLRRDPLEAFDSCFDVTSELASRIRKHLDDYQSFSQFTDLLKTRNLTRTMISRALLHILLNIQACEIPDCLRVLGFRKEAELLLKKISSHGTLPLVTSVSDPLLSKNWRYADRLYETVRSWLHGQPFQNEARQKMLVISRS